MIKLTSIEKESALWKRIEREASDRLAELRTQNDGNLDAIQTAKARGQISMCKEVLAWAITDPHIT